MTDEFRKNPNFNYYYQFAPKVFVCSPYKANQRFTMEENLTNARTIGIHLLECGLMPLIPHEFYSRMLDDNHPGQRSAGILLSKGMVWMCDLMLVVRYENVGITEGMMSDIGSLDPSKPMYEYRPDTVDGDDLLGDFVNLRKMMSLLTRSNTLRAEISKEIKKDEAGV